MTSTYFTGGRFFDGERLKDGVTVEVAGCRVVGVVESGEIPGAARTVDLHGDILSPGFVDLQVNGGGGIMFNDTPSVATLRRMAEAHAKLGAAAFLPTLITDTRETTRAALAATVEAIAAGVPGIAGLHLEGPHLSVAKKGAHDSDLIRPMESVDLSTLLSAADALPCLMVTVAPESVTEAQVATLADAGVFVSLGHTDAPFEVCKRYFEAGARFATHLFNAMSQLQSRAPGLVGAALGQADVSCGMIADAVHVHPEAMRLAWAVKSPPGRLFLVSDAMAVAGTDLVDFKLGGRRITRRDGVLTLDDGTLAGADLDLLTAVRVTVEDVGVPLERALQAATSVPASLIGYAQGDDFAPIRIAADLSRLVPLDERSTG